MNNKSPYYFVEQVLLNSSQRIVYSFPDVIKDQQTLHQLIATIESDPELKLVVLGDASRPEYSQQPAKYVWELLDKHPVAATLRKEYPGIENYRISAISNKGIYAQAQPGDDLQDIPFYKFDTWANKGRRESGESMPSFKQYIGDVAKYNPQQTSGASTKTKPLK